MDQSRLLTLLRFLKCQSMLMPPQAQEHEPEVASPAPVPNTSSVPMEGVDTSSSRPENPAKEDMSKEEAKAIMEECLLLPLEQRIGEEQYTKVFQALDVLPRPTQALRYHSKVP